MEWIFLFLEIWGKFTCLFKIIFNYLFSFFSSPFLFPSYNHWLFVTTVNKESFQWFLFLLYFLYFSYFCLSFKELVDPFSKQKKVEKKCKVNKRIHCLRCKNNIYKSLEGHKFKKGRKILKLAMENLGVIFNKTFLCKLPLGGVVVVGGGWKRTQKIFYYVLPCSPASSWILKDKLLNSCLILLCFFEGERGWSL